MGWTGDPLADFARHDREETAWLNKLPKCGYCNEPIQDGYCYVINDETICGDCLNEHHRRHTEDFID